MRPATWMLQASCLDADDASLASTASLESSYEWVFVPRHGLRPLAAPARLLLRADNRCRGQSDWSELTIYETVTARLLLAVRHVAGTSPIWRHAWNCPNPEALRACIAAHNPVEALPADAAWAWATGQRYPDAHAVAARVATLKMAWAGLLAAVFGLRLLDQPGQCPA